MAMPETARRWTKEMVQALPDDGNRYELVGGELLVTPAPVARHQIVCRRFGSALDGYLRGLGLEDTLVYGPADISWTEHDLVQPDILVVALEHLSEDWRTFKHLRLVAEILSPSSRRGDRVLKRRLYQEQQVETYWVADPERNMVEVWRPGAAQPAEVTGTLTWQVTPDAPELRIPLEEIFKPIR